LLEQPLALSGQHLGNGPLLHYAAFSDLDDLGSKLKRLGDIMGDREDRNLRLLLPHEKIGDQLIAQSTV
jgi:hypothetical protein